MRAEIGPATPATRFILIEPSHPGNVGATARAMAVMGFDDLVLVRPYFPEVLGHPDAVARASGATHVLDKARVLPDLASACEGMTHLCATVMTPRDFGPPTITPRQHMRAFADDPQGLPSGVAFLFGCERFGMANEDVYRCHAALSIPSNPAFGSLNLAAAVQLIAYDWRETLNAIGPAWSTEQPGGVGMHQPADARQVAGLVAHWEQALVTTGFLDPRVPKKLVPRLEQLFARARPSTEEVNLLRGIAKSMQKTARRAQDQAATSQTDKAATRPPIPPSH